MKTPKEVKSELSFFLQWEDSCYPDDFDSSQVEDQVKSRKYRIMAGAPGYEEYVGFVETIVLREGPGFVTNALAAADSHSEGLAKLASNVFSPRSMSGLTRKIALKRVASFEGEKDVEANPPLVYVENIVVEEGLENTGLPLAAAYHAARLSARDAGSSTPMVAWHKENTLFSSESLDEDDDGMFSFSSKNVLPQKLPASFSAAFGESVSFESDGNTQVFSARLPKMKVVMEGADLDSVRENAGLKAEVSSGKKKKPKIEWVPT